MNSLRTIMRTRGHRLMLHPPEIATICLRGGKPMTENLRDSSTANVRLLNRASQIVISI